MTTSLNAYRANLTIRIEGAESNEGLIQGLIFKGPDGFPDQPDKSYKNFSAPIEVGVAVVEMDGLSPGKYAVVVFHDHDGNGKMRKGAFGIPKDAYGFSNNARAMFSAPSFESASFQMDNDQTTINIDISK